VGVVSYAVSYVDLTFDSMMKSNTASGADSSLDTPNGMLPAGSLTNVATSLTTVRVSFPSQNSIGYYELHYGPQIQDIYGDPMSAPYIGSFVIWPPVLSGHVTDAHGAPVPYATIRPSGGFLPTVTDATGFYSIEVAPNWAGTLAPVRGVSMFIPSARVYTNVTSNLTNENFALVTPADLTITAKPQGPNLVLGWHGINGVGYQVLFTTNMVPSSPTNQILWTPYAATMIGTNGPRNFIVPTGSDPQEFFRFTTSY
jgi:hypothetical protein